MLVSFHDVAKLELNEAAQYYESESPGLGQAFITAVERCTDEIVQYPEAGLVVRGSIRRRLIRRFPYALLSNSPSHLAPSDAPRTLAPLTVAPLTVAPSCAILSSLHERAS